MQKQVQNRGRQRERLKALHFEKDGFILYIAGQRTISMAVQSHVQVNFDVAEYPGNRDCCGFII